MNPITNPFAPGAGTPPPELAGRDELRKTIETAIERNKRGFHSKSILMVGLRGVGKTVLLDRMQTDAREKSILTMRIEAPERRSLPAMIVPQLRQSLLELSRTEKVKDYSQRALRGLRGFAKALKFKYEDIEIGFDQNIEPEPGLADNGDLEHDLQALFEVVGMSAKQAGTALVMFIDELQYVPEEQLEALITALHRTSQLQLPVMLVGAGLPQLAGRMGRAKSYAERLFDFPQIGALPPEAAKQAISKPLAQQHVLITDEALDAIINITRGYPYFLQEWGKHAWDIADYSPITLEHVNQATIEAVAALDESFFRVRLDRLTPHEKKYLMAMAELGAGPHRSGDIAEKLGRRVQNQAPIRNQLILKGIIWSPNHGETAFTVPLFDEYMRRIMI